MGQHILVKVQEKNFDVKTLIENLTKSSEQENEIGAIATFIGRVRRNQEAGLVDELFLEHYPVMTEKKIEKIAHDAFEKFQINGCTVVHRIGNLTPGELIIFVGVSSRHRKEAFEACSYVMDFLKTEAPFWKKETSAGGERWVKTREEDYIARDKWSVK